MNGAVNDEVLALLTPEAVRERCHELFVIAEAGELDHFSLNLEQLDAATTFVMSEIRSNYPDGKVPFHSRWRHFEFGVRNLWAELSASMPKVTMEEMQDAALTLQSFLSCWMQELVTRGSILTKNLGLYLVGQKAWLLLASGC